MKCIPNPDSAPYSREIDSTDIEIILLVTEGSSSSYSIWSSMKKEAKKNSGSQDKKKKVMAYININKRVTELSKMGLLEEIKPNVHTVNIHGRKDYKVTMKGLEDLMPHIITHPEDARTITQYIDRFGLDKRAFGDLLVSKVVSMINFVDQYLGSIKNLDYESMMNMAQIEQMQKPVSGFHQKLMDMYDALHTEQSKQVFEVKTRDGRTRTVTHKYERDGHDAFLQQEQRKIERGLSSRPEIADTELEEDLSRLTKPSKRNLVQTNQTKKSLSLSSPSQKKKRRILTL